MRIFRHYTDLPASAKGCVVALGNFDGVHRGHQAVISKACEVSHDLGAPSSVMTFEPHPRSVFHPDLPPFRLTPLRIKAHCLENLGVDFLIVLCFDLEFASITAEDFVSRVLVEGASVRHVVVGYDFVFGRGRSGDAEFLSRMAERYGFGFTRVARVDDLSGVPFSSTKIRDYIEKGEPARAAMLLNRPWEIEGRVVVGSDRGKSLGFPTANIHFEESLAPACGVYAVRAGVDQGAKTVWLDGVANFGRRPTFGEGKAVLEVHLFDFSGDLYGKHLRVALVDYLRPEKKFDGLEDLQAQIASDSRRARILLAHSPFGRWSPTSLPRAADVVAVHTR